MLPSLLQRESPEHPPRVLQPCSNCNPTTSMWEHTMGHRAGLTLCLPALGRDVSRGAKLQGHARGCQAEQGWLGAALLCSTRSPWVPQHWWHLCPPGQAPVLGNVPLWPHDSKALPSTLTLSSSCCGSPGLGLPLGTKAPALSFHGVPLVFRCDISCVPMSVTAQGPRCGMRASDIARL